MAKYVEVKIPLVKGMTLYTRMFFYLLANKKYKELIELFELDNFKLSFHFEELQSKGLLLNKEDNVSPFGDTEATLKSWIVRRAKYQDIFGEPAATSFSIEECVETMGKLFAGKKPGVGTKGDVESAIKKMSKWTMENPEYSKEQVLNATLAYVNSQNSQNFTYLMKLHYFIYKDKMDGGIKTTTSTLLDFIDEDASAKKITPFNPADYGQQVV